MEGGPKREGVSEEGLPEDVQNLSDEDLRKIAEGAGIIKKDGTFSTREEAEKYLEEHGQD